MRLVANIKILAAHCLPLSQLAIASLIEMLGTINLIRVPLATKATGRDCIGIAPDTRQIHEPQRSA
jgi:hypothetical protein